MKPLRLAFCNYSPNFRPEDNFLRDAVERLCPAEVVDVADSPDILFFSCFRQPVRHHEAPASAVKVYYTGENDVPDFNLCDYALSSHILDFHGRHMRLPMYSYHHGIYEALLNGERLRVERPLSREFCSVVVSNISLADPRRQGFWQALHRYKPVASGGRALNNVGGPVDDKMLFSSRYKFCLALENSSVPGYVTEKIVDAFLCGSVPIYWGDGEGAKLDFNPDSFINVDDFPSVEDAVAYIRHIDETPSLYLRYLEANPVKDARMAQWQQQLSSFLQPAVAGVKQLPGYGYQPYYAMRSRQADDLRAITPLTVNLGALKRLNRLYQRLRRRS